MESGNGEAARPVLGDGEGGPRWSFSSQDYGRRYILGFLDRIVVGKDSNTFLVWIKLYLAKIQKKS
jgi:hypothetical protein